MRDLPGGWVETTLGELCQFINGRAYKQNEFKEAGTPIVRIQNLTGGGTTVYSDLTLPKNKYIDEGDLIYAWSATFGPYIWKGPKSIYHYHIWKLLPKEDVCDKYFLYYKLKRISDSIRNQGTGSIFTHITKKIMEEFVTDVPPLPEQKAIADMLSSFDEKIELLREQNKTLETLAQTIFKEWFVHFNFPDPHGKPYRNNGGEMVESELGLIPKGWRVGNIEDVFDFLEGPGIRNWQYTDSGTRFINIRLIQNGDILVHNSNFVSDEEGNGKYKHFHLQEKDFVLSTSGTLGRGAIVRKEHLPMILNTSVIRFRPKDKRSYGFLYQFLQSRYFLHELQSLASGSVQLNFGPMHLRKIRVIIPDVNALSAFARVVNPLYEKITSNLSQVQTLSKTRDVLLPKLMSGQVRVQNEEVRRAML